MPKFQVDTNAGSFEVELDRPPSSHAELMQAIEGRLNSQGGTAPADSILSPQDIAAKTGGGYAPPAMPSQMKIMETLNAPIEAAGNAAGHYVQSKVEPLLGGTASDIAGALTKEGLQFLGPQALSTGARLGLKLAAKLAPGAQGGRMESLIGKAQEGLYGGLSKAKVNQTELTGLVNKIPESSTAPLPNTRATLEKLIAAEEGHTSEEGVLPALKKLKGLIDTDEGVKSIQWIDAELSRIGDKTGMVKGQEGKKVWKSLFASMAKDLENTQPMKQAPYTDWGAPTIKQIGQKEVVTTQPKPPYAAQSYDIKTTEPGTQTSLMQWGQPKQVERTAQQTGTTNLQYLQDPKLAAKGEISHGELVRTKDKAYRRASGFQDVIDEFNNMVMTKRGTGGAQDINANRLGDKLKRDEFLQKSLQPEDWKDIEPLLAELADTAALPAGKGASYGSGRALARGSVAALGAAALGGNPYTWGAGVTALDYGVGYLLMKPTGRSLIKAVLESKAYEPSQKFNIINGMGRLAEKGVNAVQGGQ
jgi:hypothetical protein